MSHVVTIRTQVRDPEAVRSACRRLAWPRPFHGEARLYAESLIGLIVQPPGWTYPAVCDLAAGELRHGSGPEWGTPTGRTPSYDGWLCPIPVSD